mmetsp:Transcript_15579/g.54005  ORF Transcript_15579/g.54005 Transcript_15579/m.54005 type:complete len:122 (+) Transcript_15579:25-390(+)
MRCFILSALALAASALQAPSRVGAPATSSAPSPVSRYASETFRSTSVKMNIFGNKQREEEAEAARLDAEQEALNQRWAKETMQETQLMTIFGVGTSLPVIYLIYLAFAVDDSVDLDGTGIY